MYVNRVSKKENHHEVEEGRENKTLYRNLFNFFDFAVTIPLPLAPGAGREFALANLLLACARDRSGKPAGFA
jgi:hypothetical protein